MLKNNLSKGEVITFKRFAHKRYSIFCSLRREVRISTLTVATLMVAHNACLATRADSLKIVSETAQDRLISEAEVSASRVPLTLEKMAGTMTIITRQDIEHAKVQSVNDLLKMCAGVDVRQRGGFGIQTDISIGGGTFDQIAILINGISINNPQTGHLTADFPVALSDILRIEVIDGASARTFGSQALGGAINIITKDTDANHSTAGIHTDGGSYGTFGAGGFLSLAATRFGHRLSGDFMRSDGGTSNSDFSRQRGFYQGHYDASPVRLDWQTGVSHQKYGANTFYSAKFPNQWEENTRYLASLKATSEGRIHLSSQLSWIRSYDHFQLIRNTATAENFHRGDVFTSGLHAWTSWALGRTAFGGELRSEGILSTNLGKPLSAEQYVRVEGQDSVYYNHRDNRTNISFYLEHDIVLSHFTVSAGVMTNRNTSINDRFSFYPGIDVAYRPAAGWKVFASCNRSLRLPTFTDLYYKSTNQEGNVGLKAEEATACKVGAAWTGSWWAASVSGAYRHGTHMIDWVMFTPTDIYHSTNFTLSNVQLLADCRLDLAALLGADGLLQSFSAAYAWTHQKRHDDIEIYKSCYALDYLRHKLTLSLSHRIWSDLSATWDFRWQQRLGSWVAVSSKGTSELVDYKPYALLSLKLRWTRPRYDVYLSMDNLTNHRYYDLGSVPQPGFWLMAGGSIHFDL